MITILVVGFGLAGYLAMAALGSEIDRTDELFRRNANDHIAAIENGVRAHIETVRAVADFTAAEDRISADGFHAFATSLRRRHPAIQALWWVPWAGEAGPQEPGGPRPGAPIDSAGAIPLVDPAALAATPAELTSRYRRVYDETVGRALATGTLQASSPIERSRHELAGPVVLVLVPVTRASGAGDITSSAPDPVRGFAVAEILVPQLFEQALSVLEPAGQDMWLIDATGQAVGLHTHISRRAGTRSPRWWTSSAGQLVERQLEVGGRVWLLSVRPHAGFYRYDWSRAALLLLALGSLSVVLAVFFYQQSRREQRVRDLVSKRTAELSFQATHDPLTGLNNRLDFERRLRLLLEEARVTDEVASLCYIDLDQFKVVNDTSGHAAGDELLRQLGPLLEHDIREGDSLARLGGDEFGLILRRCAMRDALAIAERLIDRLSAYRFVWNGHVFNVGASIGMVQVDRQTASAAEALSRADAACYIAKDKGRGRFHVFSTGDRESDHYRREMEWLSVIRTAIEDHHFELWFQPIVPLADSEGPAVAAEILLRLRRPGGRLVPPMSFLPAAERYRLMPEIDRWVVCRSLELLAAHGGSEPGSMWSINLSGQSLGDMELADLIVALLVGHRIRPERVCFEITETALISNLADGRRFIERLRRAGCRFALDDFGSGMSSFTYLKSLPVDLVKIDGSFVRGLATDAMDRHIVRAINDIAHSIGIRTVAESVESEHAVDSLRRLDVDLAQGYHLGRPEPIPLVAPPALADRATA